MRDQSRLKPLLHFVLLGALLFAAKLAMPLPLEVLLAPSVQAADEEILVREALRLGLERSDPVVRSRLVRNMRFIDSGAQPPDEAALFEQALALGMARSDLPARRRLVQALHERLTAGIEVSEAEVREYVGRNPGRYAGQPRLTFRQELLQGGQGAASLLGARFTRVSEADVARSLGPDFARAVMSAPLGRWSDSIQSPYGVHRVYLEAKLPGRAPDYAVVRSQARYALLQEREAQAAGAALARLRRNYAIEIEPGPMALAVSR